MTTTEAIQQTQALIVDMETRRQAAAELGEQARAERGRVALAAAEGDVAAIAELDAAATKSARSIVDIENVGLALSAARERLAGLEEQAETERLAREREEALAVCGHPHEAAQRVDQALAALGEAMTVWQATTPILRRYGRQGQDWLDAITIDGFEYFSNAVTHAAGYDFARRMGFFHVPHDTVLPLVETDPVLLWAMRQRGEPVDTRSLNARAKDGEISDLHVALAHMGMAPSTEGEALNDEDEDDLPAAASA
jgi:hypothetical protein